MAVVQVCWKAKKGNTAKIALDLKNLSELLENNKPLNQVTGVSRTLITASANASTALRGVLSGIFGCCCGVKA